MNSGELRTSNYNYDATALLGRVRGLFERDDELLGCAVMRAVLADTPGLGKQHVMTRIDILPKTVVPDSPELLDYGTVLFVKEVLSRETMLNRLATLSEKRFQIGEQIITSASLGFHDTYEHSRNSYSDWPCTLFDISFGHAQLSYEPLLHPTLESFSSTYDAIQKFLKLDSFNGQSDSRLGHLQIVIPNLNARIETLTLARDRLNVRVVGVAPPGSIKVSVTYKNGKKAETIEKRLHLREATFHLKFSPNELGIWLVSMNGFLADFHTENQYHPVGANALLPKHRGDQVLGLPVIDPGENLARNVIVSETHRVVILTALSLEYKAVRAHLKIVREKTHPRGTVYEEGEFTASDGSVWEAYIAEIGAGNSAAARETERAISQYSPEIIVFVGIAGGLKDVAIGDVVVATKVYGYESGKAKRDFHPRPQVHNTAYELQQRARAEAKREDWFKRVGTPAKGKYKVFVAPIASGEKVLASRRSVLSAFLRDNYGDALATEMEGWGFLDAAHASADVRGLIVRGISDLIDGKSEADASGSQVRAAKHASAFAFEVLSKVRPRRLRPSGGDVAQTRGAADILEEAHAKATGPSLPVFQRSSLIDNLIKNVVLGDDQSSVTPAIEIVKATNELGHNELLENLLNYQDCEDQDTLWKALPTVEACAEISPHLFTHAVLSRMANNSDFSVRSSAASICMNLAQHAPDRVPVDLLIKLSVYSEDWYVETPANAALKAMVRSMPAILGIFFTRLHSGDAAERVHTAQALAEIARREPEVLDPAALKKELSRLRSIGDKDATALIARILPRVRESRRLERYKYGL